MGARSVCQQRTVFMSPLANALSAATRAFATVSLVAATCWRPYTRTAISHDSMRAKAVSTRSQEATGNEHVSREPRPRTSRTLTVQRAHRAAATRTNTRMQEVETVGSSGLERNEAVYWKFVYRGELVKVKYLWLGATWDFAIGRLLS